ncbi:hypothetical protein [Desulfobacter sp.]|uniref:hypothetical protein n=1 Tax=Desulfobacter sp. TaxID=2294 RepID=UPI003D1157F4
MNNRFFMLPYMERDGIRTAADSTIKALFTRTGEDGLVPVVFYEGTIATADAFLSMAKAPGTMFFILMDGTQTIGYTWLNRFENHTARQHFCIFKSYWGNSLDVGKWCLHEVLHMQDNAGSFVFDLVTGFVPAWNKRAINFVLKCGGQTHGVIPNAIFNGETGMSEKAVFIYYTREKEA